MERVLSSKRLFDGRILSLRVDEVETQDGHRSTREVVDSRGAAAIVCIDRGELVLVRQYRHPVGRRLLEIPAGIVDEGEDPETAAARELVEEVGLRPRRLEHLVSYLAAPGFTNHHVDIYLTEDVEDAQKSPDEGEILEIVRRPVGDVRRLLASGEVADAKTLLGLALLAARA